MIWAALVVLFTISCGVGNGGRNPSSAELNASAYVKFVEPLILQQIYKETVTSWNYESDINDRNADESQNASVESALFSKVSHVAEALLILVVTSLLDDLVLVMRCSAHCFSVDFLQPLRADQGLHTQNLGHSV